MQCSKPSSYSTTSSAREQCRWNFEAKRHRRGQVEYEFKPGWLLNGHLVAAHVSAPKMCSRKFALEKGELIEVHPIFEVDDWICNALHFGPNGFPLALRRENGDRSSQNSIAI